MVVAYDANNKVVTVQQRNKVVTGAYLEIIGPQREYIAHQLQQMRDIEGNVIESAPNAMQFFCFDIDAPLQAGDIIRQRVK